MLLMYTGIVYPNAAPAYAKGKPQLAMLVSHCLGTSQNQEELHHLLIPNTKWCKAPRREIHEFLHQLLPAALETNSPRDKNL